MKKIKSTMAAVAQITTTEQIIGKKRHSADDGQKKKGIIKGIFKALSPNKYIGHPKEPEEIRKEPTAEDIQEQIEKKLLLEANNNLIDLERKILKDPLLQGKTEELKALYEKFEKAVFQVIEDSITERNGDLLSQAVKAIEAQETEDAQCGPDNDSTRSLRPKQWRKKWERSLMLSIVGRIGNLSEALPEDSSSSSSLSQSFISVGKTLKQDLVNVVTNLKEHYPKDFDVCNTYALHYHCSLTSQINFLTSFQLGDEDTYYLLCFVHNYYPNMILKDPVVAEHINDSNLDDLVEPDILMELEGSYFANEIESVKTYLNRCLDMAVDRWKSGKEPEILGNCHHSELHIDIVQIYNGAIKKAKEIKKEIAESISCLLSHEMKEIFKRYKTSLEEFLEKNKTHSFFREIGIANLNCCFRFREFIERRDTMFDPGTQQQMLSTVVQCEDLIYAALLQELFLDLKAQFKKKSQGSSLCSHQTMQDIVKMADRHLSRFSTLCPPYYKDMVARIHKHLVKEYLIRILKRKVSHKNALQLQTLAAQIYENAGLLSEFCDTHKSEEDWLKPVIPKVAEIIRLQDLSAIQLEVATLVGDYPDIRNKQIEAILYIKGNLSRQDIKSILKVADTIERDASSKPKLFELLNS